MNSARDNLKASFWSKNGIWITSIICIAIVAGTFSNVISCVAFVLCTVVIVALSEDDALGMMMFVMPFANIFKISPSSQSFFTYLLLFYVLWYFIKYHYIHKSFLISFFFLLLFLIIQMFLSVNILRMIKLVANILFIYIAVNSRVVNNSKILFLYYIFGVVLSSLVVVLNIVPNFSAYVGVKGTSIANERVLRFAGMYGDPNYYSVNVIISLCLLLVLKHKNQLTTILTILLSLLLVFFAGLTFSKSAFFMLILPLILWLKSMIQKRKYFALASVVVVCIIFATALFSGKISFFNGVIYRITEAEDLTSLTTGRFRIWKSYYAFLSENLMVLLFGRGFGAELLDGRAAHNTYIDLLYYLGIVGSSLLFVVFGTITDINKGVHNMTFLNRSVWICVAVMYFFLSELFYFDCAFHIILAILVSKIDMGSAS